MLSSLFSVVAVASAVLPFKHLSGPPSEFPLHRIPSTTNAAIGENSYSRAISIGQDLIAPDGTFRSATYDIFVDSTESFAFTTIVEQGAEIITTLTNPSGQPVNLEAHLVKSYFPGGLTSDAASSLRIPCDIYVFKRGTFVPGKYTVTLSTTSKVFTRDSVGRMVIFNESPIGVEASLATYNLKVGQQVGVRARLGLGNNPDADPRLLAAELGNTKVDLAELVLTLPTGKVQTIKMKDDGLGLDAIAGDGVYTATVVAPAAGTYRTHAVVEGVNSQNLTFQRSVQQMLAVSDDGISIAKSHIQVSHSAAGIVPRRPHAVSASIAAKHQDPAFTPLAVAAAGNVLEVLIPVSGATQGKYRLYAEVWGANSTAGGWVGGMSLVESTNLYPQTVTLHVDAAVVANLLGPHELRNVAVFDVETHIPLATASVLPLGSEFSVAARAASLMALKQTASASFGGRFNSVAARFGIIPKAFANRTARLRTLRAAMAAGQKVTGPLDHGTALVHGYCAGENPFKRNPSVWTHGPFFFLDSLQSRSIDVFAQMVHAFMEDNALSYAAVGHSQGGAVSTHLHNYYWSGIDAAISGLREGRTAEATPTALVRGSADKIRLVQTVGTPFNGNSAAGSAADLGSAFGIGCGVNFDMSLDGAKLWTSGLSSATRASVHFSTTTYKLGNLFGDSCNVAMNLVLQWPNDGTCELKYALLEGGVNLGNTQKQCHCTDMNYMPQYDDLTRNAEYNKYTI